MRNARRALLATVLTAISAVAMAQGLGIGIGIDDIRRIGATVAPPPPTTPCDTNFVFDWTDPSGCQGITVVIH